VQEVVHHSVISDPAALHLVWLKRDLRVRDHAPLAAATKAGRTVALYIFEPAMLAGEDHAPMHTTLVLQSLRELEKALGVLGIPLWVRIGEVVPTLDALADANPIAAVYSHEETGNLQSYARDKGVKRWARARGLAWYEFWQNGVQRPHPKRDGWAQTWNARMSLPRLGAPRSQPSGGPSDRLPTLTDLQVHFRSDTKLHSLDSGLVGEQAAEATLASFLETRGRTFRTAVSSPIEAWTAGSRLSAHLAYGNISLREVVQRSRVRLAEVQAEGDTVFAASLESFLSRLAWHCHFMQKLEDQPSLEREHAHPGMKDLRNEGALSFDEDRRLRAWKQGKTGYPMVDAVMRCLLTTGWINFRMRAMLVSFASYDLWLDWRPLALHLAKNFIDYEPGIHYPQVQMQAGTTGTNSLRMYDPTKQLRDWDPEGTFVRQWVPELANLSTPLLRAPSSMSRSEQQSFGVWIGKDYPAPIVNHVTAVRHAKAKFAERRLAPQFRRDAQQVFERHGSRRRLGRPG
jgi:deoxyribodipyrimidine photo-lyase